MGVFTIKLGKMMVGGGDLSDHHRLVGNKDTMFLGPIGLDNCHHSLKSILWLKSISPPQLTLAYQEGPVIGDDYRNFYFPNELHPLHPLTIAPLSSC